MRAELHDKLNVHLGRGIKTEADVVYFLTLLRKLWEADGKPPSPIYLWMHWALHVNLDRQIATKNFLKELDEYISEYFKTKKRPADPPKLLLQNFRGGLSQTLEGLGVSTRLCKFDSDWNNFLNLYSSVIKDGSLTCEAAEQDLTYVEKVTFKKGEALGNEDLPFRLIWEVHIKNKPDISKLQITSIPYERLHGLTHLQLVVHHSKLK